MNMKLKFFVHYDIIVQYIYRNFSDDFYPPSFYAYIDTTSRVMPHVQVFWNCNRQNLRYSRSKFTPNLLAPNIHRPGVKAIWPTDAMVSWAFWRIMKFHQILSSSYEIWSALAGSGLRRMTNNGYYIHRPQRNRTVTIKYIVRLTFLRAITIAILVSISIKLYEIFKVKHVKIS